VWNTRATRRVTISGAASTDARLGMIMIARRIRRAVTLFAFGLVLALTARPCFGQGTSGLLPDPISSRKLGEYARTLGLSEQQRLAIEGFHDSYLDDFSRLRESDIEEFLEDTGAMRMAMQFGLDQEAIERSIRTFDRLMGRIRTMDERLFDQIQQVLTEDQLTRLPRVRQVRERARYRSGIGRMMGSINPAARVDLTEVLGEIVLTPDDQADADAVMIGYEQSLTGALRKMHDASLAFARDATRRLSALDMSEEAMADREKQRELITAARNIWIELSQRMLKESNEIGELNRRTVGRLIPVLPPGKALKLHEGFQRRAYADFSQPNPAAGLLEAALARDDLSASERESISGLRTTFHGNVFRIANEADDLIDEQRETETGRFSFSNAGGQPETEEKLDKLRRQQENANDDATEALFALLGPDRSREVERSPLARAGRSVASVPEERSPAPLSAPGVEERAADATGSYKDPFVPGPITAEDTRRYAQRLRMDEEKWFIVQALHHDYVETFNGLYEERMRDIATIREAMWSLDGRTGQMKPPSEEKIDRLYDSRRRALDEIGRLDSLFFSNVRALVPEELSGRMRRVELGRMREVFRGVIDANRSGSARNRWSGAADPSREAAIDVSELIVRKVPHAEDAAELTLITYEQSATTLLRTLFQSELQLREQMDKAQATGGARGWRASPERAAIERQSETSRRARWQLVELNRATIDRLDEVIAAIDAKEAYDAYVREAFPDLFADAESASTAIGAAMQLDDLSSTQRGELAELSSSYFASYDDCCNRMVTLRLETDTGVASGRFDWDAYTARQRELEKLKVERSDLNEKTLVRLRALLTPEQRQRAGLD
jgi:hypothetical protein